MNAVDLLTLGVLLVGIVRGRKRGLSEEILDTLQWLAIVIVAGCFHRALAGWIGHSAMVGRLFDTVVAYLLIALTIKLFFAMIKRRCGEKITESDLFGRFEYYLGMAAGMVRFACIYFFLLNFLHAPYYSPESLAANAKYQEKNFGDIHFPTLGTMQQTVFKESMTGWMADTYLDSILIRSTGSKVSDLRGPNSIAKRREHAIDLLITGK